MISSKFAKALLAQYKTSLTSAYNSLSETAPFDKIKRAHIFTILETLNIMATPVDSDASQIAFSKAVLNSDFEFFCKGNQDRNLKTFYEVASEKLQHPHGPHVNGVKAAYGGFFSSSLPKIAFSPIVATFSLIDSSSESEKNWVMPLIYTGIFAVTLLLPPVIITMLCAAALAVLAGLTYPVALAGAALGDLGNTDNDDIQGSFVHP